MSEVQAVESWRGKIYSNRLELIVGLSIFATAAAGGAVRHVASISLAVLFIACLAYVRSWPRAWRQLSSVERLILLGFGLYVISAFVSYANVTDEREYVKHLGKYARFLLIVPIYLLLTKDNIRVFPYLLAGAVAAGPVYLVTTLLSLSANPGHNAEGAYHHITFGDTAMLAALFLSAVLIAMKTSRGVKIGMALSIVFLLYASIMSQARGAWLALPAGLLLLWVVAVRDGKIRIKALLIALVLFGMLIAMSPAKDIIASRVQLATGEIELFQQGKGFESSVGSRLAMWHIAINTWKKHPVVGSGLGDFDLEMREAKSQGLYVNNFEHSSAHSIYFQALIYCHLH